mmetsp:Transcript_7802/g.32120  ORF Transcript_7802/g.32120 Transcript_7802/m.32120 type:complete len:313 (+) Transcript_7802:2743-3681(+)
MLHALVELLLVRLFVDAHGPVRAAAHKPTDAVGNHAVDTLRIAQSRYRRLDLVELDDQQLAAVHRQDAPLAALGSLFPVRHLGVVGKPTVRRVILNRARLGGRELNVRKRPDPGFRALERAEEALARARRQTGVVRGESHLANGARVRSERLGRHARELFAPLPVPQRHVPFGGAALRDDPLAVGGEGDAHVLLGPDVGGREHALPGRARRGGEIVHGDDTPLRAFRDGHVALALAEGDGGDGLGVRLARDEPLRLRLHVVQHQLVAGDVRHGGLVDVGDVVRDITLGAEDVPRGDRRCRHDDRCRPLLRCA